MKDFLIKVVLVISCVVLLAIHETNKATVPVIMFAPPAMIHSEESFRAVPLLDVIASLIDWDAFFDKVSDKKEVYIVLNGPGGWLAVLDEVRQKIREISTDVKMTVIVTNFAASADAMAVCEFQDAIISPNAVLVYHQVHTPNGVIEMDEEFETCKKKGFITEEELQKMNEGYEVWVRYTADGTRSVEFKRDPRIQEQPAVQEESTPTSTP